MSKKLGSQGKFPKSVGGVKLPKKVRRAGAKLIATATSPIGLELIAASLSMASAAALAAVERERAKRLGAAAANGSDPAKGARAPRPPVASNDPHDVGVALGRMAEAALVGLFKPKA